MKRIGILTAMSKEFSQLAALLTDKEEKHYNAITYMVGHMGQLEIFLMQCGIGKVNAAMGVTLMLEHVHPEAIISTGVAGGLDDSLHVMDVVVSRQTVYHDMWCGPGSAWGQVQGLPERLDSSVELVNAALTTESDVRIIPGLICTGDLFVSKSEEQQLIKSRFPEALAVDMESCAIAQVCQIYKVPFVSFRIISDTPGHHDNISQYLDFWKTMADKSFSVTHAFLMNIK